MVEGEVTEAAGEEPCSLSSLLTSGFDVAEEGEEGEYTAWVGEVEERAKGEAKERVGELANGWPTPTLPGDMDRLIPDSAALPLLKPAPLMGIACPLPGEPAPEDARPVGEMIPLAPPIEPEMGIPDGGDALLADPAELLSDIGVGEACGISSARGMALPTSLCPALPALARAKSPESKYLRSCRHTRAHARTHTLGMRLAET